MQENVNTVIRNLEELPEVHKQCRKKIRSNSISGNIANETKRFHLNKIRPDEKIAGKDLDDSDVKKQEELEDITTCCICTEVYTDPKALPCIHTFCMKCLRETGLKTNKGPGDEMPCPICRRLFKIPTEGFHGLPENFFIERLIEVSNVPGQPSFSISVCDACAEENNETSGKEIPVADTFCVDCSQKFCQECCRHHRKFKLTKNHNLLQINKHDGGQNVMTYLAASVCETHQQKVVDVYCADCKTVVCAICFIEEHKNHEGSHVSKFVDGFRKQLQNKTAGLIDCIVQAQTKKVEIVKVKEDIQRQMEKLECEIVKRKHELKQLTDTYETSLLQGLCSIRQSRLKEIQMATDDVDAYLSCLETYNSYCQKIMDKGSASDICRAFSDLSVRVVELQQQCQPMIDTEIQSFNVSFRKSEIEDFLEESCDNLIGEIEEEGDLKPKKGSKQSLLVEHSKEINLLRKEIEIERTEIVSLQSANEQLRINVDEKVQVNKVLTEELSKQKTNYDAHMKKLKQELDNRKLANNTLQADNDNLKQEINARNLANNLLQINNDKLKQELDKEKIACDSLQASNSKLKQELYTEKMTNNSLQASNSKLKQELYTEQMTNTSLQASTSKMNQELHTEKMTNNSLETSTSKMKQELYTEQMTNNSLQTSNGKLKQGLYAEKMTNNALQVKNDKLKQEVDKEKIANNSLQASNNKLLQEVNTYKATIRALDDNVEKLKQELYIMKTAELLYMSDPVSVQTIRRRKNRTPEEPYSFKYRPTRGGRGEAIEEEEKLFVKFTILDKDLFVVSEKSSEVGVYDSMKLSFSRRWNLKELINPLDICACNWNKCLYVIDSKGYNQWNEIFRVDRNGKLITKWSTEDEYGYGLSVTHDSNVLLTVFNRNKLNEYSPDGQLIRKINLPSEAGILNPSHAIKLINGHFLICHGYYDDKVHRVCVVDAGGKLRKAFGGNRGSSREQMHDPCYLTVDENGFVMVTDYNNSRVLLLDSEFEFKREILSKDRHRLRNPRKILLDEPNGRLFVADHEWDSDGRILIFQF